MRDARRLPRHTRTAAGALLACALAACAHAPMGGYPNRVPAPGLAPPASSRDDAGMYMELIRQMQRQGAYYASLAHIDAYRQRYGDPPELRRLQADALRETRQDDAARRLYQGLLGTSEAAAAWHGLGLIDAAARRYAQAEPELRKATELEPIDTAYLGDLGYARLCAGRVAEAREPLAKAAELAPGNVKAVSNLALWALLDGDGAQADTIMQRASLPPATRDAVRELAVQLRLPPPATTAATAPTATARPATVPGPIARIESQPAQPVPIVGVPAPLLDRLGAPAASREATP